MTVPPDPSGHQPDQPSPAQPQGDPGRPDPGPPVSEQPSGQPSPGEAPFGSPSPADPSPGRPFPGQPYPGQPYAGQPSAGQPVAGGPTWGQSYPGQPYSGQPYAGQPYPGQGYPGQPYPGQAAAGQSFPGQPNPGQPYPGQAHPGQPFWGHPQAGQPYAGQAYPGQPVPPGPDPATAKRSALITKVVAVLLAAAIGVGIFLWQRAGTAAVAEVGDCFEISGASNNATEKIVECSAEGADFVVTETREGDVITCEIGEYPYVAARRGSGENSLCLRPNVSAGDCWNDPALGTGLPGRVPCSEAGSETFRFTGVHLDSTDPGLCSAASAPLVLPERRIVYCVELP